MLGISAFGGVHTVISLIALASGFVALAKFKEISPRTSSGRWYIITTILTCLTGFFIFHHGGFGPAHVLGLVTLVVLALAWVAGKGKFGGASRYIETLSYSLTFFFHFIPTVTETATRLPAGAPFATDPNAPIIQKLIGVCFVLCLLGAIFQIVRLRASRSAQPQPA